MTTFTSMAAYSLMTCGQKWQISHWIAWHQPSQKQFWVSCWTCLMALAPTESMKQTSVQSRMMEWTDTRPSSESDLSASSTWLFPFSSATWLGDRVSHVSLCSVNWPKGTGNRSNECNWDACQQFNLPHVCSVNKVCATGQSSLTWEPTFSDGTLWFPLAFCFCKAFRVACACSGFTPV